MLGDRGSFRDGRGWGMGFWRSGGENGMDFEFLGVWCWDWEEV